MTYIAPSYEAEKFTCPHCQAITGQSWYRTLYQSNGSKLWERVWLSICMNCAQQCVWVDQQLVNPRPVMAPAANQDMPSTVHEIFEEARLVSADSPRAAAALLRLCIQMLCIELGQPGKNLNTDIGELVKVGLPPGMQQALDTVRVIGNNAVHPGYLDFNDSPQIAQALFDLTNMIVEKMISDPKKLEALYAELPSGALEAIEKRDEDPAG